MENKHKKAFVQQQVHTVYLFTYLSPTITKLCVFYRTYDLTSTP